MKPPTFNGLKFSCLCGKDADIVKIKGSKMTVQCKQCQEAGIEPREMDATINEMGRK